MPEIDTHCLLCGEPFRGRPNRLHCSTACRKRAYRLRKRRRALEARRSREWRLRQIALQEGSLHRAAVHAANLERIAAESDEIPI